MTLEQLKEEADKLGYKLIRKSVPKLTACKCGIKKPPKQYRAYIGGQVNTYYFCPNCSKRSSSFNNFIDAIIDWNNKNEE